MSARYYVLFRSSFRYEAAPSLSHETINKVRTLCGRKVADAETLEPVVKESCPWAINET